MRPWKIKVNKNPKLFICFLRGVTKLMRNWRAAHPRHPPKFFLLHFLMILYVFNFNWQKIQFFRIILWTYTVFVFKGTLHCVFAYHLASLGGGQVFLSLKGLDIITTAGVAAKIILYKRGLNTGVFESRTATARGLFSFLTCSHTTTFP